MKKNKEEIKFTIFLGILCLITTSAIVIQIKTNKSANSPSSVIVANDQLRDKVIKLKYSYDNKSNELEKTEKKLEKVRQKALQNDNNAATKEYKIKEDSNAIGMSNLSGQGVEIKITTNKIDSSTKGYLDNIVNELKNAGAEAISINGNRMVFTSVISFDGSNIQVNSQKIESPFEIKAIGETSLLYGALVRPGGYVELLNSSKIKAEVSKSSNLKIEKFDGLIDFKNLKTVI